MDVSDHAAVNTAVMLASTNGVERQKGFVNGVLRNALRKLPELMEAQDPVRLNTPAWLLETWIKDYGLKGAALIAEAHLKEAPLDITVRDMAEFDHYQDVLEAESLGGRTLRRKAGGAVIDLPDFDAGRWWVQDAAAALPAQLFGDVAGKRVVDMCAAPGGKTMQLASMGAEIVAIDRSTRRAARLKNNLERLGFGDAVTIDICDAAGWCPKDQQPVPYILLDAPCSATGTARRHPEVVHLKSPKDVKRLRDIQMRLLRHAFEILAPGGVLIYCTCTLQKSEGEDQIAAFLAEQHAASKIAVSPVEVPDIEGA